MTQGATPGIRSGTSTHPMMFLILCLPFGISQGYITVTLVYLLSHAGVSVLAIAGLAAINLMPQSIKFLWAPLIDTTLTSKHWYVLGVVANAGVIVTTTIVPMSSTNLLVFQALVLVIAVVGSFNLMAADSLMAHGTTPKEKGRAAGWAQAGNLGGTGLGGGVGLWLGVHLHHAWISGVALAAASFLCCLTVCRVGEPERDRRPQTYWRSLMRVGCECWELVNSRLGFLAILIVLVPIGSGGAQNLWPAIAGDWRAGADTVALVNGTLGGMVTMVGCVAGGFICDRVDRKRAYCLFGLLIAASTVAMAVAPRTAAMFAFFTLLYAFTLGLCYAAFAAVALETVGKGAAATKYSIIAGVSNLPLTYEALIDGWAQTRYGSGGMLYMEGLLGMLAVTLYFGAATLSRGRFRREIPLYEGISLGSRSSVPADRASYVRNEDA